MADKHSMEIISALVDGELAEHEMQEAIRKIRSTHEECCSWERYHLIGDSLRNNLPTSIDPQFLNRISTAIASEPALNAAPPSQFQARKGPSIKPVAGFALAASVALTAFLGVGMLNVDDGSQAVPPVASNVPTPESVQGMATVARVDAPQESGNWNVNQPDVASKLNDYLSSHQAVSVAANGGMLPHIRLVNETSSSAGQ